MTLTIHIIVKFGVRAEAFSSTPTHERGAISSCPFGPLYCAPPLLFADLTVQLQLLLSYLCGGLVLHRISETLSITTCSGDCQRVLPILKGGFRNLRVYMENRPECGQKIQSMKKCP